MVGIDLDLVPEAADYRHRHDPDARLVIAVPGRDLGPGTALTGLVAGAEAVEAEAPWSNG